MPNISTKRELARSRNWLKLRLTGLSFHGYPITEEEQEKISQLISIKNSLLDKWDENTRALGFNIRPKKERFNT